MLKPDGANAEGGGCLLMDRRGIFELTSDDIPIYTFFSNFMRDPDIEEFFLVLLSIILRGSLDGLQKALQKDPAYAAHFQDSTPGTKDAGKE